MSAQFARTAVSLLLNRAPVPLYHQLKELLVEKIESGAWGPGYQLPPELQLAAEFQVSRATVRQAMQLLASQGLIERRQGLGTFVARPKISHNLLSAFTNGADIAAAGTVPRIELLALASRAAPQNVSLRLGLAGHEKVWDLKRAICSDSEPIMLITSWLPAALFPALDEKGLDKRSLRHVLLSEYSVEAGSQHKEVEITALDETEADLLGGRVGMPALLVTYLSRLSDGRPYEYRKMVVRGDRSKYHVDLDVPEHLD
jgi:GntR family transcriptional regulator